jgi:hypothetical protein
MSVQNNIQGTVRPGEVNPGYFHTYSYWPKQRQAYGDHWYSDGWVIPFGAGTGYIRCKHWTADLNRQPKLGDGSAEIMVKATTTAEITGATDS